MLAAIAITPTEPAIRARFLAIFAEYEAAIERLSRGYERDPQRRRDLEQDIWTALWRALPSFEGRASERTWLYRVAHNVAATHLVRRKRDRLRHADSIDATFDSSSELPDAEHHAQRRHALIRLEAMVRALKPLDRQLVLLFLEGVERPEIAEITGLSPDNVSVRLSRLRSELATALGKEEQP